MSPFKIATAQELNRIAACNATDWVSGDQKNRIEGCLGGTEIIEEGRFDLGSDLLTMDSFGLDVFAREPWKTDQAPFVLPRL